MMNSLLGSLRNKLKHSYAFCLSFIPTPLPRGMKELNQYTSEILALCGVEENDSYHFAIANMIMHSDKMLARVPKRHFVRATLNAMAKEVAFAKLGALKEAQKKREAAPVIVEPAVEVNAQAIQEIGI